MTMTTEMPAKHTKKDPRYCSFCGKNQDEVATLIAGPTVFICNECIGLCNRILEDKGATARIRPAETASTESLLLMLKVEGALDARRRIELQEIVDVLRKRDVSWATIGEALGVSRQAAWDRFS